MSARGQLATMLWNIASERAGLPRITIYDPPRKPPKRRIPWEKPAPKRDAEWLARISQMALPL